MADLLTYREAARRVHRSVRAIKRWRSQGMPMGWQTRDGQQVRVVDEDVLLGWFRDRLRAWPPRQFRRRRRLTEKTHDTPTR